MSEREDWEVDPEGNLTPPGGSRADTDEFGRTDPDSLERERRRREREQRRRGKRPKDRGADAAGSGESGGGEGGGLRGRLGGRRKGRSGTGERAAQPPPRRRARPEAGGPEQAQTPPRARAQRAQPEAPKPRRPRSRAGAGGYGRRRIAAIAAAIVGLLLLWFLIAFFQPFAGDGDGDGRVIVNIPEGASADEVADILTENDVVSNGTLFGWRLRLTGKSDEILPGRHLLASGMSYGAAIDRLTEESSEGLTTLSIPEGLPRDQVAPLVEQAGIDGNYMRATKSFKGFNPAKYGAKNPPSLEGFLFPATYELEPGSNVRDLVAQQLQAFEDNFAGVNLKQAKKANLTPYDVLKIASMVDREVAVAKERPMVAAVIYNRLRMGEPLGIDATIRYEDRNYDQQLTASRLAEDTPYNSRLNVGLPPTPIGNPGLEAIEAAAKPADDRKVLFFVVKPGTCGEHAFANTLAEFEKLEAEYQQALQEQGESPTEC